MEALRFPVISGRHQIIIVGAGSTGQSAAIHLVNSGITDFVVVEKEHHLATAQLDPHLRLGQEVISSVFDEDTDTWTLKTGAGELWRANCVIACDQSLYTPWTPNLFGCNDYRGVTFHAASPSVDFDPTGKHIGVIGADAISGRRLGRLLESAASVTVFAYPPRRFVSELPHPTTRLARWLRRRLPRRSTASPKPSPHTVTAPIQAITTSGIRTNTGSRHQDYRVDAIIYGTGLTLAEHVGDDTLVGTNGVTMRQAWRQSMEPYRGIAVHGFPNYFFTTGPDSCDLAVQIRDIIECLQLMRRHASTRIQVRHSSQQVYNERAYHTQAPALKLESAFDLVSPASMPDEIYDGPATLTVADHHHPVRVRLSGHIDPIDGQYHWQGTIFDSLTDETVKQSRAVQLTIDQHSAAARIAEQTPWGTRSVTGVGVPPFRLTSTMA
ncbi:MAG: DUF4873 domain-containing protein [Mycobacteriaceae bacterium]|nr:DUF4873 domain-containing protein [Mycobacteriaceae bacterium]